MAVLYHHFAEIVLCLAYCVDSSVVSGHFCASLSDTGVLAATALCATFVLGAR